jgi:hypothetical protein
MLTFSTCSKGAGADATRSATGRDDAQHKRTAHRFAHAKPPREQNLPAIPLEIQCASIVKIYWHQDFSEVTKARAALIL